MANYGSARRWEQALHAAIMADEYEAIFESLQPQAHVGLQSRFEAARAFSQAAQERTRRRYLAALVCRRAEYLEDFEAPVPPFDAVSQDQSRPSEPPGEACYNTDNVRQEAARASDSAGRVRKAGRQDRARPKVGGRAHQAQTAEGQANEEQDSEAQAPHEKAIEFLRFYFTDDPRYERGRGECEEALGGVLEILHGSQVLDIPLRRDFELWMECHPPKRH